MQDQFAFDCRLGIQRFLKRQDRQSARNSPVGDAGHHAPVIQVNDTAIIADISIFQKQVCEIRTPLLIDGICMEVLF